MAMADIADHACRHANNHAHSHVGAKAVPLSEIASRQALPIAYLEQLFAKLRAAGLVGKRARARWRVSFGAARIEHCHC